MSDNADAPAVPTPDEIKTLAFALRDFYGQLGYDNSKIPLGHHREVSAKLLGSPTVKDLLRVYKEKTETKPESDSTKTPSSNADTDDRYFYNIIATGDFKDSDEPIAVGDVLYGITDPAEASKDNFFPTSELALRAGEEKYDQLLREKPDDLPLKTASVVAFYRDTMQIASVKNNLPEPVEEVEEEIYRCQKLETISDYEETLELIRQGCVEGDVTFSPEQLAGQYAFDLILKAEGEPTAKTLEEVLHILDLDTYEGVFNAKAAHRHAQLLRKAEGFDVHKEYPRDDKWDLHLFAICLTVYAFREIGELRGDEAVDALERFFAEKTCHPSPRFGIKHFVRGGEMMNRAPDFTRVDFLWMLASEMGWRVVDMYNIAGAMEDMRTDFPFDCLDKLSLEEIELIMQLEERTEWIACHKPRGKQKEPYFQFGINADNYMLEKYDHLPKKNRPTMQEFQRDALLAGGVDPVQAESYGQCLDDDYRDVYQDE